MIFTSEWEKVRLSSVAKTGSGGTPSRSNAQFYSGNIPWVKSGELNFNVIRDTEEHISTEAVKASSTKIVPSGTLLIALYGATVGRLAFLGTDAATNQAVCFIIPGDKLVNKYLYYFLMYKKDFLLSQRVGGAQPNISQGILNQLDIDLPPVNQQLGIVAKIEELFSEIDNSDGELQSATKLIKTYQQAIVDNVFDEISQECGLIALNDIADIRGGVTKGRKLKDVEIVALPYLRVANVQDGYLDLREIKYIPGSPADLEKYQLQYGDILFTEGGDKDKLGRGTIWRNEIESCIHQNHIFRARVDLDKNDPEFISFAAQTSKSRHYFFSKAKQTTNLASINMSQLKMLEIPDLPLNAQREIVARIKELLSNAARIKDSLNHASEFSRVLKKAVLSKAFKGELI